MLIYVLAAITRVVIASCIIIAGIATIGNGELFDRGFLFLLSAIIIYALVHKKVDLFTIAFILFAIAFFDETLYLLPAHSSMKLLLYITCVYCLFVLRDEPLVAKVAAPILLLSLIAEIYWFIIQYQAPQIFYYNTLIALNLIARRVIYIRLMYRYHWFKDATTLVPLDRVIYNTSKWFVYSIALLLIEYMLRHTTSVDSLYIYYIYPYFQHFALVYITLNLGEYTHKTIFKFSA